ncbi:hypothetical protein ABZ172_24460 [Streptomyces sp. NPDC006296]|uniref:hypothetical protein n=1 Tax=Streptomyces sp. NPDC006296 TaxID=3156746 RepID=UPI0033A23698
MEADRIDRIVSALRARGVMAHRAEEGVYEFGIRVVIPDGSEALWTVSRGGLDAQVLRDSVLMGFVPHIPGSGAFSEQQTVDAIAATRYSEEALRPARRSGPDRAPGPPPAPPRPPSGDRAARIRWLRRRHR